MKADASMIDLPEQLDVENDLNPVERTIRSRKTSKVFLPVELRHEQQALWHAEHVKALRCMLEAAAWAPFHKRAHQQHCNDELDAPMPWRFHVLDPEACTRLLGFLESRAIALPESKWAAAWQSKIKEMLCSCGVLVQVTWLPDPPASDDPQTGSDHGRADPEFTQKNIEHVAAASSAIQSLLIAAQSHQWFSYWSSGGILRDEDVFDYMNIDRREHLLGSVFLSPEVHPSSRVIDGGLRDQRGELAGWVHWV